MASVVISPFITGIKSRYQATMAKEGRVDVLVNNAGFGLLATLEEGTDEEMFQQFDVNVFGLIKMTRAVLPHMRQAQSGVVINISSFLGKMGLPLLSHYNASKYAVEGITDFLRFEVAPFGIRVHSVLAGLFGTNFVKKGLVANSKTTSADSPSEPVIEKCWLEMLVGDLVYSMKKTRSLSLQEELNALCDVLENAIQTSYSIK